MATTDRHRRRRSSLALLSTALTVGTTCLVGWSGRHRSGPSPNPDDAGVPRPRAGRRRLAATPLVAPFVDPRSVAPRAVFRPGTTLGESPATCYDSSGAGRKGHACVGDRLGPGERLGRGMALCARGGRYMLRVDGDGGGALVRRDCARGDERAYGRAAGGDEAGDDLHLVLGPDATLAVVDGAGRARWRRASRESIRPSARCMAARGRTYDCPFLHIHPDGKVVVHWTEEGNSKLTGRTIESLYDL